jgi:hypothetical protein
MDASKDTVMPRGARFGAITTIASQNVHPDMLSSSILLLMDSLNKLAAEENGAAPDA